MSGRVLGAGPAAQGGWVCARGNASTLSSNELVMVVPGVVGGVNLQYPGGGGWCEPSIPWGWRVV